MGWHVGIIEIEEVETALGESIPESDVPRVQWYIDTVSAYVENVTGRAFSEQTDAVHTARANSWGCIEFPELTSVTLVELLDGYLLTWYDATPYGYRFDGIDTIYNLVPHATYRLTVTYGPADPPDDIIGVVTQLVMAGTGYDISAVGGLTKTRTGDVEDVYGVDSSGRVTLSELMQQVLDSYHAGWARA